MAASKSGLWPNCVFLKQVMFCYADNAYGGAPPMYDCARGCALRGSGLYIRVSVATYNWCGNNASICARSSLA